MKAMMKLGLRLALASAILPALAAAPLSAEGVAPDPHWLPWLGCWQAVAPGGAPVSGAPSSEVCVVPTTSPSAVEVLTITDGAVASRDRIDASGTAQPSSEEGCTGTERVEWSEDGHRLYRTTEQRCTGGIERKVSGVLAILPTGEWLNAQGVTVGGNTRVHVLRYQPVTDLTGLPAEASRALDGQKLAVEVARSTASATPTSADIAEASRHLDSDVVGAWLIERGESFTMDAGRLVELANAGVPDKVIDLMVALSYPHKFAINQATGASEMRPDDNGRDSGRRALRPWGYYDPMWGYDPYWYGPYRYGYGAGYGWGWGGYNGYYGGYYGSPVVVVRPGNGGDESQGTARAVKGRGYTRDGSSRSTGSSSRPSSTRSSGSDRSGSSSSSGSARSSGGSSSSSGSGSSTGRTAKPRGS